MPFWENWTIAWQQQINYKRRTYHMLGQNADSGRGCRLFKERKSIKNIARYPISRKIHGRDQTGVVGTLPEWSEMNRFRKQCSGPSKYWTASGRPDNDHLVLLPGQSKLVFWSGPKYYKISCYVWHNCFFPATVTCGWQPTLPFRCQCTCHSRKESMCAGFQRLHTLNWTLAC